MTQGETQPAGRCPQHNHRLDIQPCMRFSRTRLTDVVHRRHSVCTARPGRALGRAWVQRRSIKVDQPEVIRGLESDHHPAEPSGAPVASDDDDGQPHPGISHDLVEVAGRVPVAEVGGPAAEEAVDTLHDPLDRQQPPASGQFPDPVAGMLHRLARGPAGQEGSSSADHRPLTARRRCPGPPSRPTPL